MAGPGPLEIEAEGGGQGEHAHRVGRRRAVDDHAIPAPEAASSPDLVQAEHFLNAGQRRKFFGGNVSQIRFREPTGQGDLTPSLRQQGEGVQRERVEESAGPGIGPESRSASTRVGSRRSPVGTTLVPSTSPSRVRLVGGDDQHPQAGSRITTAVAVANVDLPTPPLPTKRLILAPGPPSTPPGSLDSLSLDSFLEILQCGVGQSALGFALEQSDHRDERGRPRARR
jgi:hypothetical protein